MKLLSDEELEALLLDLESDRVERKENAKHKDRLCEAICAFANDLPNSGEPGVLMIGVRDDGTPAGLDVDDTLMSTLGDIRSNGKILPPPMMTVQKRRLRGEIVVVIEVEPSSSPPVRYEGRVWVRIGPRRAIASAEEERRLAEKRRWKDLPFDQRGAELASLDDLDLPLFSDEYLPQAIAPDILEANERTTEHKLRSLRLLTAEGHPTYAAILLFSPEPRQFVPGAYLQFVRFDGSELTDPILDQKEVWGPLPVVLRQIDEICASHIHVRSSIDTSDLELRHPDYPKVALQQLVRNAVMHRNYETSNAPVRMYWFSDRIEISNPGSLYGSVNPSNFGRGATDYRNPLLAEAFKVLGFVQRFGIGVPTARKALQTNGNPLPEFNFNDPNQLLVTLRERP